MTRHRPADPVEPLGGLGSEPRHRAISRSTTDYVEPAGGLPHRRQKCTKPWCATGLSAPTTILVDAHSSDLAHPIGVGPQQGFAPTDDLVVHCMPITTQLRGDLVDRAAPPPHLDGHPPSRSRCQQRPFGTNLGALFDERSDLTPRVRTRPAPFPPPQPHRPSERRQIHQHHAPIAFRPHRAATALTHRPGLAGTDHHLQRCLLAQVVDPDQINLAQTYQLLAHARRITLHRGPPASDVCYQPSDYGGPPITSGGLRHHLADPLLPPHFRRATNVCLPTLGEPVR